MHEILGHLREGARVLDVGCREGSYDASLYPVDTIRTDIEAPSGRPPVAFVQADVANLPFRKDAFIAIVANHSLEHFENLDKALEELARVVRRDGSIYVAVPDSTTFCDRVYRWLTGGGGHLNAFSSRADLIALIERYTGMRSAGWRSLMASFVFLNRKNWNTPPPRKLLLLGGGREGPLVLFNGIVRLLDRRFHSRLGVYGWALYFGSLEEEVDRRPWSNVCIRCGAGYASVWLRAAGLVRRIWGLLRGYHCPACGASNIFSDDEDYMYLQ
jgi:SAM-dependent methyltransferase